MWAGTCSQFVFISSTECGTVFVIKFATMVGFIYNVNELLYGVLCLSSHYLLLVSWTYCRCIAVVRVSRRHVQWSSSSSTTSQWPPLSGLQYSPTRGISHSAPSTPSVTSSRVVEATFTWWHGACLLSWQLSASLWHRCVCRWCDGSVEYNTFYGCWISSL